MPFWRTFYHVVWTTQERRPQIERRFEDRLYAEVLATVQRLGGTPHAIGGTENHVHLIVSVPPTVSLATFIGQIKGSAAHYVNHECGTDMPLVWGRGYGLFTLGSRQLVDAVTYVRSQKQHHADTTTQPLLETTEER